MSSARGFCDLPDHPHPPDHHYRRHIEKITIPTPARAASL